MIKWHVISEEAPNDGDTVMILLLSGMAWVATYDAVENYFTYDHSGDRYVIVARRVTHWASINYPA